MDAPSASTEGRVVRRAGRAKSSGGPDAARVTAAVSDGASPAGAHDLLAGGGEPRAPDRTPVGGLVEALPESAAATIPSRLRRDNVANGAVANAAT